MNIDSLEIFLDWMTQHTVWVNIFIFIIAMSESLLVVGLVVPGFLLMVGFGALISTGHLDFWPTTLIAIAGAICGDGLSFYLGQHYQLQLQRMWPLSRYPALIQQGNRFFEKHGKKSVMLGRFFGPLRAIVPTIAGMSGMPAREFYFSNILSALIWAPLYLLPGILFGMSLQLAKEFAGQLAFLIVITIVLILLIIQLIKTLYGWLAPQADVLSYRLIIWARRHPLLGSLPDGLVNPKHPEIRAISSFAILLVISAVTLIAANHYLFNTLFLNNIDLFIRSQFLQLQHPVATQLANYFVLFSEYNFLLSSVILFSLWNFYKRNYKAVVFMIASLVLPWLFVLLVNNFSFSLKLFFSRFHVESHLYIAAISVYGFITIYLAKNLTRKQSRFLYTVSFIFVSLTGLALLYLGILEASTLAGYVLFGLVWVSILGIAYRRHPLTSTKTENTLTENAFVFICSVLLVVTFSYNTQIVKHKPQTNYIIGHQAWLESGWTALPAYRNDLRAFQQQPLNIQWAASNRSIINTLEKAGWQRQQNTAQLYFNWLNETNNPLQLPVVKHIHNGEYNLLTFTKLLENNQLVIIRLWPSKFSTQSELIKKPLWLGEIALAKITRSPFLNYLTTVNEFKQLGDLLKKDLDAKIVIRKRGDTVTKNSHWDGQTLLIDQPEAASNSARVTPNAWHLSV